MMNPEHIDQQVSAFAALCRERGLAVTHQRLAIYRAVLGTSEHPSAEGIYKRVRENLPALSLATVYKNLETLKQLGVISEVNSLHETARYDADTRDHHHVVCVRCHRVMDLYDVPDLSRLRVSPDLQDGFKVLSVRVQVNGICRECGRDELAAPAP